MNAASLSITVIIWEIRSIIFPDFSAWKLGLCIIHEKYIINFFSGHMPHPIQDRMTKNKLYLGWKIMCFMSLQSNILMWAYFCCDPLAF